MIFINTSFSYNSYSYNFFKTPLTIKSVVRFLIINYSIDIFFKK